MITEELIKSEIERLEKEAASLKRDHECMVLEDQAGQRIFQHKVMQNRNRYQQLTGAITHFKQLLNGKHPEPPPPPT